MHDSDATDTRLLVHQGKTGGIFISGRHHEKAAVALAEGPNGALPPRARLSLMEVAAPDGVGFFLWWGLIAD